MTKVGGTEHAGLTDALKAQIRAGTSDGADFATLMAQVSGETNFKTHAVNHRTGAAGPFQFVKNTWLSLVQKYGQEAGIDPSLLAQIKTGAHGRPHVDDHQALTRILDLRFDVGIATKMASKYTALNKEHLGKLLGRQATDAEVQMSFLLGAAGAAHLIKAAAETPSRPADAVVPHAVAANRSLFRDGEGHTLSAADAVEHLAARFRSQRAKFAAYTPAAAASDMKIDA